jgi:hypothetical protein
MSGLLAKSIATRAFFGEGVLKNRIIFSALLPDPEAKITILFIIRRFKNKVDKIFPKSRKLWNKFIPLQGLLEKSSIFLLVD